MQLNSNQILEIIPHRYPFVLVDRIIDGEPGVSGVGIKAVTQNEYFFQGHFPEHHVMPGVLIVEALAQVGAVCLLMQDEFKGKIAFFAGINNFKFKRQVIPGDVIRLEITMTKIKGSIGIGEGKALVDGKVVAQGELKFAIGTN